MPDRKPSELSALEAGTGWKAAASVEFFKLQDPWGFNTHRSQVTELSGLTYPQHAEQQTSAVVPLMDCSKPPCRSAASDEDGYVHILESSCCWV